MLRPYRIFTVIFFGILAIFLSACSNDTTNPIDPGPGAGTTKTLTSDQEGSLNNNGFIVNVPIGAVPRLQSGGAGTVVFSINTSSTLEQGVSQLPSGYTRISDFVKVGPEQFVFNMTIRIYLPAGSESSPNGLVVMGYYPETNEWKIVPSNIGTNPSDNSHYLYIDVLKLGYFVLLKSTTADISGGIPANGGVQWCSNDGLTFVILTIASATLDPAYPPGWASTFAAGLVGSTFISPNWPASPFPSDFCRGILPLGSYTFWVSTRSWMSDDIQTYSIPVPVTVSSSLNWPLGWIYTAGDGWTIFGCQLPAGGSWVPGRPTSWPPPTQPFGTGTVQATLTWVNSTGSVTDLDLHLYGPNNLHIYFGNPTSTNFAKDRDWTSDLGNAIENIYSTTTTVPTGDYRIEVNHFSGASKSFNCRVIVNGSVTNYSGTLSTGSVTARSFTIQ